MEVKWKYLGNHTRKFYIVSGYVVLLRLFCDVGNEWSVLSRVLVLVSDCFFFLTFCISSASGIFLLIITLLLPSLLFLISHKTRR